MNPLFEEYLQKIKHHFVHRPTAEQEQVMRGLVQKLFVESGSPVIMLRGYAGTGKTSLISALVRTLLSQRITTLLMAPTGRAAKVLAAYSGHRASTIHRRIYYAHSSNGGQLTLQLRPNKLHKAVLVVDEASMIADERSEQDQGGRSLLDDLMTFVEEGKDCKLILVGDVAQLPPVGLNISPALNTVYLKNTYHLPVIKYELTEVVRQQQESGILYNATSLRQAMVAKNHLPPFVRLQSFNDIQAIEAYELKDELEAAYGAYGQDDVVIITRSNKTARRYNEAVRRDILQREHEIDGGDMLMVVKNNYFWLDDTSGAGFLANGDILEVMGVSHIEEKYGFRFANAQVRLSDEPDEPTLQVKIILDTLTSDGPALSREHNRNLYRELHARYLHISDPGLRKQKIRNDEYYNALQVKFAYAMTCHKTQGGQWHTTFIDQGYITEEHYGLNYLRWFYTALTRATHQVFLINYPESFIE